MASESVGQITEIIEQLGNAGFGVDAVLTVVAIFAIAAVVALWLLMKFLSHHFELLIKFVKSLIGMFLKEIMFQVENPYHRMEAIVLLGLIAIALLCVVLILFAHGESPLKIYKALILSCLLLLFPTLLISSYLPSRSSLRKR